MNPHQPDTVRTALLERPIFIAGAGRSGTTLLRSLLSAHSRISIAPETQFMNWVSREGPVTGGPADFDRFWTSYTSWVRFKDLAIDADRCRELVFCQGDPTFGSIFRAVLTAYGERVGKPRVGEKSPSHVHYLKPFLEWFPDARVLITQRDPRAVVASQLKTPYVRERIVPRSLKRGVFTGKRTSEAIRYARDWLHIHDEVVPGWREDPRVRVISYEALVLDSEAELRGICDFLGERYEPSMLTGRSSATVPQPAGVTPNQRLEQWRREHHATSLRPISADSLDKWKSDLSGFELALVEGICHRAMQALGYAPSMGVRGRLVGLGASWGLRGIGALESRARPAARKLWHRLRR